MVECGRMIMFSFLLEKFKLVELLLLSADFFIALSGISPSVFCAILIVLVVTCNQYYVDS